MRFAVNIPAFADLSDPRALAELAHEVEAAGWDGFFDEITDPRTRARRLDEGLDILSGLWTGEKLSFEGDQFHVWEVIFRPTPVQTPRIPTWVGGWWPHKALCLAPPAGMESVRSKGATPSRRMSAGNCWRMFKRTVRAQRPSMPFISPPHPVRTRCGPARLLSPTPMPV